MTPRKENATIKHTTMSTGNIVPGKKQTMKAKRFGPLKNGKQPRVRGRAIFISHLPNGFFEEELERFFSQFGTVTKVFISRSPKTNRSRGYGFVEFQYAGVARIAASAVDNYLMFGKILKASVVQYTPGRELPKSLTKMVNESSHAQFVHGLKTRVSGYNEFIGEPVRQSRRIRQMAKVQKALDELKQAEIELPDMPQCFEEVARLVQTNSDSKRFIKPAPVKKEEDKQNADSSDEEDAFVPLKPSDWVVMDSDSIADDEGTTASQKLLKVEKGEGLKSKAKKTAGGKVQIKTEKKKQKSENAKKSSRKTLGTGTSK